jgi:DNA-binding SARP family transcriptional activator
LNVLNGFELRRGGKAVPVSSGVQRLLVFLALHARPLHRAYVAARLWLDVPESRASANLRSTLWRAHRLGIGLVTVSGSHVTLTPEVVVDVSVASAQARRLLAGTANPSELGVAQHILAGELLPDWYEDWVVFERERYRQLALHALDTLAHRLTELGRFGEAAEAAFAAIAGEPLRESAHRALIRVHLAEGNPNEALRHYRMYRTRLGEQLGLAPSSTMNELVGRCAFA